MISSLAIRTFAKNFPKGAGRFSQITKELPTLGVKIESDAYDEVPLGSLDLKEEKAASKKEYKKKRTEQHKSMRNMSIKDQINSQKGVKGKQQYYLNDEQSVDWFIKKFVDPELNRQGTQKYLAKKEMLQQQGFMPDTHEGILEDLGEQRSIGQGSLSMKDIGEEGTMLFHASQLDTMDIKDVMKMLGEDGDSDLEGAFLEGSASDSSDMEVDEESPEFVSLANIINEAKSQMEASEGQSMPWDREEPSKNSEAQTKDEQAASKSKKSKDQIDGEEKLTRKERKRLNRERRMKEDPEFAAKQKELWERQKEMKAVRASEKARPPTEVERKQQELLKQYSTQDPSLNAHIFGNVPLIPIDFGSKEVYSLFNIKKPDGKKQIYKFQLEKLRVMFEFYSQEDFDRLRMFSMNADQLVQLLNCSSFVPLPADAGVRGVRASPIARKEKVVECLNHLVKTRQLRQFDKREDVRSALRYLTLDHSALASLQPQSYVTTIFHTMAKMKVRDQQSWLSLASYFSQRYEFFDIRSISNIMYSFYSISQGNLKGGNSDVMMLLNHFDPLFDELELTIVKKLDQEAGDPQSIANLILAYSKTQNGSGEFFYAMEAHVINNAHLFNGGELAQIVYSFHKSEQADCYQLLEDLMPILKDRMHKLQPKEMASILMAYVAEGFFEYEHPSSENRSKSVTNEDFLRLFDQEFRLTYEQMNPEDISKFYYCFTRAGLSSDGEMGGFYGSGKFYKYLQKALTKTIKNFDSGNLRFMFTLFAEEERSRLNKGVRGRLTDRLRFLMSKKEMKGFDVNSIYEETKYWKQSGKIVKPGQQRDPDGRPQDQRRHDVNLLCQAYLERIKYFR